MLQLGHLAGSRRVYVYKDTVGYATEASPRAEVITPGIAHELSDAAKQYATAAQVYLNARGDLTDAQQRWSRLMDQFAQAREKEGV
jgi:hypothetical protein